MVHLSQRQRNLDQSFGALSDSTRRGILQLLGRKEASVSELAEHFEMTLTGMKKHVALLEGAGLVATRKVGRVRHCCLGQERLERELHWLESYRRTLEERLDHLEAFLERTQEDPS